MSYLVDRRVDGKGKSTANRQRFLRRYRKQIKQSVNESMAGRSIEDTSSGGSVSIPREDMHEPQFRLGPGGRHQRVFAGNKKFGKGDMIRRPPSSAGQGGGGEASDSGLGEDEFVFQLTRDEFLEVIFDQLELPNLVKQQLTGNQKLKYHHGGVVSEGNPSRINIVRSFRSAHARRIATSGARAQRLQALQQELECDTLHSARRAELLQQIEDLTRPRRAAPFIDDLDIRYNLKIARPEPTCQAVMICVMDVSGSMDERTKDIAKRFYMLLYLFLQQQYKKTEVVFVRHHTEAKEVDEEDFFYARETGGTVVSSALKLTHQIITERYPADSWNVYVAQASDGDNWSDDCAHCLRCLQDQLLPLLQQYFYVEIAQGEPRTLWRTYELLLDSWGDRFSKRQIGDYDDIYPVFRQFFEKRVGA